MAQGRKPLNVAVIPDEKDESQPPMTAALTRDPVCLVLRRAREEAGYDVADIAQLLRIQRPYLEAIEDGRYSDLPGTVYAIGFVRTYSDFLNLDTNDMVRRFKEEAQELSKRTDYVFPVAPTEAKVPGVGLLVVGVLLAALAYGAWHVTSAGEDGLVNRVADIPDRFAELASRGGEAAEPTAPPPAAAPEPTASETMTDADPAASPSAAPPNFDALAALAETRNPPAAATTDPAEVAVPADAESPYEVSEGAPPAPEPEPAPVETVAPVVVAEPTPPPTEQASQPTAVEPIESAQVVETIRQVPPAAPEQQSFDVAVAVPEAPSANAQPKAATEDSTTDSSGSGPLNILPTRQVGAAPPPPPPAVQPDQPRRAALGSLNSRILIRATEMSWVQITDDRGNLVMTRVLEPGETYRVPNSDGLTLASGNAGGLEVLIDGVVQQPLGLRGTVVRNVALDPDNFGADGN